VLPVVLPVDDEPAGVAADAGTDDEDAVKGWLAAGGRSPAPPAVAGFPAPAASAGSATSAGSADDEPAEVDDEPRPEAAADGPAVAQPADAEK
jgi:hypothetical protein